MTEDYRAIRFGYTIVELMVTIVIVSVLAATLGTFVVKLLTIQEQDREEAYIREKLADVCATYADFLSLGTNISTGVSDFIAIYPHETGGVSLETGRVSRVAELSTSNTRNRAELVTIDLNVGTFEQGKETLVNKYSRTLRGDDTPLMNPKSLKELKIGENNDGNINLFYKLEPLLPGNGALWNFRVMAQYKVTYEKGRQENKTLMAERIVRLWNRQ